MAATRLTGVQLADKRAKDVEPTIIELTKKQVEGEITMKVILLQDVKNLGKKAMLLKLLKAMVVTTCCRVKLAKEATALLI